MAHGFHLKTHTQFNLTTVLRNGENQIFILHRFFFLWKLGWNENVRVSRSQNYSSTYYYSRTQTNYGEELNALLCFWHGNSESWHVQVPCYKYSYWWLRRTSKSLLCKSDSLDRIFWSWHWLTGQNTTFFCGSVSYSFRNFTI